MFWFSCYHYLHEDEHDFCWLSGPPFSGWALESFPFFIPYGLPWSPTPRYSTLGNSMQNGIYKFINNKEVIGFFQSDARHSCYDYFFTTELRPDNKQQF